MQIYRIATVTYTNAFSIIDHIFVSQSLNGYIHKYYSICDEVDNQSDHVPIVIAFQIELEHSLLTSNLHKVRTSWKKANFDDISEYKSNLDDCLSRIMLPYDCLHCTDVLCTNIKHIESVQLLHDNIISATMEASENIPTTNSKSHKIPGWTEAVQIHKETALFWRSIWLCNNSPRQGVVADIMRKTRAKYHYSIRQVKNKELQYKKQSMARAIAFNNSRDLWTETRKIRKKLSASPNCMDNVTSNENISELFAGKYCDLYNSVSFNDDELEDILNVNAYDVQVKCTDDIVTVLSDNYIHTHSIYVELVSNAINHLKLDKNDCVDGLSSNNFKNGTHLLNVFISLLFSSMLVHGTAPAGLLLSTLVPLIKNKRGNKCDSNNYRAIAISSLLGKLFDIIILKEQYTSLTTDVLQFGFKPHSSTTICTSLLRDTIEYYNEHGSDCYLLLLDASKAFDRVEYIKLFRTLRDRKMCPVVLRLIMNMYINQSIQVKWNSIVSAKCYISNGVKQGGCISPTFFSVYLNRLIETLRKNNIGCRYGSEFMGVYCYADDLSLLCPSFTGIKEMLRTCELYAEEHKILFNAKKSQLLHFTKSSKSKDPQLFMNDGSIIPYVDTCNHLGNTISIKSDKIILDNAVNDLYMRTNCLLSDFSFSECSTLSHLFNTYCMNIYGSPLWKYYDKKLLELFYVAWRKSLRRVWNISNVTHNNLLPYIHNCHPIEVILEKRCSLNIEHKCTGSVIRELCETRDSCNTQFFERKELLYLIEMLCTN